MKIRLYDSVQKLPGDYSSQLSDIFLTREKILEEKEGSELRDCLLAILETDLRLTAHIYVDRKPLFLGGSKVRILVTTSSTDGDGVIWGEGHDPGPEGGPYVESLHVDVDLLKVDKDVRVEYENNKKDFDGWKKFFYKVFEDMRNEQLCKIESAERLLTFLQPE